MKACLLIVFALMATAGLATQGAGTSVPASILGVERFANELRFDVISHGCTGSEHFYINSEEVADGSIKVTLQRTQVDKCRRMPMKFTFSIAIDYGETPIVVLNPIVALTSR